MTCERLFEEPQLKNTKLTRSFTTSETCVKKNPDRMRTTLDILCIDHSLIHLC